MKCSKLVYTILIAGVGCQIFGQSTSTTQFEVASIRRNLNPPPGPPQAMSLRASLKNGRLNFEAAPLKSLIQQAFDLQRDRIIGCPSWCEDERWDMIAKAENPQATLSEVTVMLQNLLTERFKLKFHRENREQAGFALVLEKGGHKLQESADADVVGYTADRYLRNFRKFPMVGLANFMASIARRPVVDATGLRGTYNFTIDLTPPSDAPRVVSAGIPGARDAEEAFTIVSEAVTRQLGIRTEPRKVSVENFIVDAVERPTDLLAN